MSHRPEPIERHVFETAQLVRDHPPQWRDRNKQVVQEIACPPGCTHQGALTYSRWGPMYLPSTVDTRSAAREMTDRAGFYDYASSHLHAGAVEWHVNFADPDLFCAYGSSLFAQDEMQVAEHPALGSLREALLARNLRAQTVEDGRPTPVLVMGAERRCRIATDPNPVRGRPQGLYGNAFAHAEPDVVRRACTRIDPPTITNVIAMAAPSSGRGRYGADAIEHVLVTAFTAFRAAVLESTHARGAEPPVVVHTGFWGCGAFGGNRVLMTTLQVLAAKMAGVDRIVVHTGDRTGAAAVAEVRRLFDENLSARSPRDVDDVTTRIEAIGFEWGVSDGN